MAKLVGKLFPSAEILFMQEALPDVPPYGILIGPTRR